MLWSSERDESTLESHMDSGDTSLAMELVEKLQFADKGLDGLKAINLDLLVNVLRPQDAALSNAGAIRVALTDALRAAVYSAIVSSFLSPLIRAIGLVKFPSPSLQELLLVQACLHSLLQERHRGLSTQTAASELACAAVIQLGGLVQLQASRIPLPLLDAVPVHAYREIDSLEQLEEFSLQCGTNAQYLSDFLRDRAVMRERFWGRRPVRVERSFTPEEVSATEAAGPALIDVGPNEVLPKGIVAIDLQSRTVIEEVMSGREDPITPEEIVIGSVAAAAPVERKAQAGKPSSALSGGSKAPSVASNGVSSDADRTSSVARRTLASVWKVLLNIRAESRRLACDAVTPLHAAVKSEAPYAVIAAYILAGADVNTLCDGDGRSALMSAILFGDMDSVSAFLSHGADVHCCDSQGNPVMKYAFAALDPGSLAKAYAVESDPASRACASPFNVHVHENGLLRGHHGPSMSQRLPVLLSSPEKALATVQLLLQHGASPLVTDSSGQAALHWATGGVYFHGPAQRVRSVRVDVVGVLDDAHQAALVNLLVRYGGDIDALTLDGASPLHCALQCGRLACAQIFVSLRAAVNKPTAQSVLPLLVSACGFQHPTEKRMEDDAITAASVFTAILGSGVARAISQPPVVPGSNTEIAGTSAEYLQLAYESKIAECFDILSSASSTRANIDPSTHRAKPVATARDLLTYSGTSSAGDRCSTIELLGNHPASASLFVVRPSERISGLTPLSDLCQPLCPAVPTAVVFISRFGRNVAGGVQGILQSSISDHAVLCANPDEGIAVPGSDELMSLVSVLRCAEDIEERNRQEMAATAEDILTSDDVCAAMCRRYQSITNDGGLVDEDLLKRDLEVEELQAMSQRLVQQIADDYILVSIDP
jgi:ankyrin repeat protein